MQEILLYVRDQPGERQHAVRGIGHGAEKQRDRSSGDQRKQIAPMLVTGAKGEHSDRWCILKAKNNRQSQQATADDEMSLRQWRQEQCRRKNERSCQRLAQRMRRKANEFEPDCGYEGGSDRMGSRDPGAETPCAADDRERDQRHDKTRRDKSASAARREPVAQG